MTVIATRDDDPLQFDPFLVCQECGEKLCSVEEGDTFDVLCRVIEDHEEECKPDDETEVEGVTIGDYEALAEKAAKWDAYCANADERAIAAERIITTQQSMPGAPAPFELVQALQLADLL